MAFILLVDPDEVAQKAMRGILARGGHRFAAVGTALEAWEFIRRAVKVDLVFVELKLKGESGLTFIQRLKNDSCLKLLPVVVYSAHGDRDSVKNVLTLRVQNFLIKPYHDDAIFSEITKSATNPWRLQHFEEEHSFCQMMGLTPEALHKMLDDLRSPLEVLQVSLKKWAGMQAAQPAMDEIAALLAKAEEAGAWGVVAYLTLLNEKVLAANWTEMEQNLDSLDFASRLIFRHLNPALTPEEFLTTQELNAENEARSRALWSGAFAANRCPVVTWPQLQHQIEALAGCPVIDSAVASFQMTANGHPASLNPLMDLVEKDPGLTAQLLIASNKLKHQNQESTTSFIEDARMAVGLLGEIKLSSLGRSLLEADEQMLQVPPVCSWPQFWMFQLGTARIARYTCIYLELSTLEPLAYTGGLMHDLGKLLLLHLHPHAFQTILSHARQHNLTLSAAERIFLGTTTHEMAAHFADKQGLPRCFANIMRWIDEPQNATEDAQLVAIVSLARDLCRQNHVGFGGDTPEAKAIPLEDTTEWALLRGSVFPSFDLKKFEAQVHAECRQLKRELQGRLANYAVA